MTLFLGFLSALLLLVAVYEIAQALLSRKPTPTRLEGPVVESQLQVEEKKVPMWVALLGVLFPKLFDREEILRRKNIVELIRRSGYYPYTSPGDFYAALLASTGTGILLAGIIAGLLTLVGAAPIGLILAALVLYSAYDRPYARLERAIRERAAQMRQNMLLGLSQLVVFLDAGLGVQEALRATGRLGGPFCNLMAFIAARLQAEPAVQALERAWDHVPDPKDTNLRLFFNDLRGYFLHQRPLAQSLRALLESVRQELINETEARASKVQQRLGLYGIFAILGMLASALLPVFLGG